MQFLPAIVLGFLGSFHCVVMCAPIMLAINFKAVTSLNALRNKLVYQSGRIFTYLLIGLLFFAVGRSFLLANMQKTLSIVVGLILIINVLFGYLMAKKVNLYLVKIFTFLKDKLAVFTQVKGAIGAFFKGTLNGILPCGMVYMAAFTAVLQPTWQSNMAYMLFFGLGTLPVILVILLGFQFVSGRLKAFANKLTPYLLFSMGIFFILRGLELGIPYISPILNVLTDSTENCAPVY